ncbi:MAG: phosphotransferase [Clostridia bacterium]
MKLEKVIAQRDRKIIYRDGNKKAKIFDESFSKADVLNEALNQSRVEETGLNIPKILSVEQFDGKWGIVSEYIEGKTIAQLMEENPDKTKEYLEMMVDLHIDVLGKPCKILNRLNDKLTSKIMASKLDAVTRFNLHRRILEMPSRSKICHGDFTPANVAVAEDGKLYIIDWSHAAQGNASADVVKTCLLLRLSGNEQMAKDYLDLYVEKSGIEKDYVAKWFPIVAAALSVDVCEEDGDRLIEWVKNRDF